MPKRTQRGAKRARKWWSQPAGMRPLRRGTLPERAEDQLRRKILLQDLRPGQRLESMPTLAAELGVSLGVVREAVAALRGAGLLEVRHGIGVFVTRRRRAAPTLRAARLRSGRRELAEIRRVIEPMLAAAAARRVTEARMRELRFALSERWRAAAGGDAAGFARADLELHTAVARAAGNALGASAQAMASVAMRGELAGDARRLAADKLLESLHERLIEAIDDGQPRRAARAAADIIEREAPQAELRAPPPRRRE